MLKGLVDSSKPLTTEQEGHIDTLQNEIDEIWSRRGNYKIDPDAWEQMPMFMENISEEDVAKNSACAAISSIAYDDISPEERAESRKQHGNKALQMALNPAQERRENLARTACYSYTEAINCKGKDTALSSTIYANRSLAQFIIGNYGYGLEDAQRAIVLNPDYIKAYFRGAKCAERVHKYDLALSLLSKGRRVSPPPDAAALAEFDALEKLCREKKAQVTSQQRKTRVQAAQLSQVTRTMTTVGIRMSPKSEVSSDQMSTYGNPQPYFDTDKMLHVPLLFMYDEFQQTDIMQDVACDVCMAELLDELMPFPWDDQGRYRHMDDVVVFYKIDDGVHDPQYYEIDQSSPLIEIFCSKTYLMPGLLPVFHVLCKSSELLERFNVKRL